MASSFDNLWSPASSSSASTSASAMAVDFPEAAAFSQEKRVSEIDTWQAYGQQLRLLDRLPGIRDARREIACTMHIPDIMDPGASFFFERIPLSVSLDDPDLPAELHRVSPQLNSKVSLWTGDLTQLHADAIVSHSHWNFTLEGAGGFYGSIHHWAGPELLRDCKKIGFCEIGRTVLLPGHHLSARFVLFCVPPAYRRNQDEDGQLQSCYESALELVAEHELRTVGFCCLGTGATFGHPQVKAAHVALQTIRRWLDSNGDKVDRIVLAVRNARQQEIYEQLMRVYFPIEGLPAQVAPEVNVEDLLGQLPTPPA